VSVLTLFVLDLNLRIMGDKSPKATHKQAAQKQAKANAANQKKSNASSAAFAAKKPSRFRRARPNRTGMVHHPAARA
jgi:hypothetical protein